jgi:hypothetical protein
MKKILLYGLLLGLHHSVIEAQIFINEFMQSNIDNVRDDLREFPDSWIELYNDSDTAVNLCNYYISDKRDYTKGWKITDSITIPPKDYILIYCDEASSGLHTSFRLESGNGGNLFIYDSLGTVIDQVTDIPKQPAPNVSMGWTEDSVLTCFEKPTPLQPNSSQPASELLPDPVFSQSGGIYRNWIRLVLSLPADCPKDVDKSNIRYTLDGSEPTDSSFSYSNPIILSEPKVVRAKIIANGYLSRRSLTNSYIITTRDFTLPVVSISLNPEFLWDDEFGIYTQGNGVYGIEGNGVDLKANWNNDWRRPMNFEYFANSSEKSVLNQLGELRIAGGWSRRWPQKSLILYSNKRFGEKKRYDYPLFKDKPDQEIKSFMIRNSGNDFWNTHFRDAAYQLFMGGKVNIDYQAYQPASVFINGVYWGIQNLRERSDEDFVLANYATEAIDMVENWSGKLQAGDLDAWNNLVNELWKSDSLYNHEWIMNQIDLDEYSNYMILQIYIANTDFPGNNVIMWRPKTETGKWRFILKDTDVGMKEKPDHDSFSHNTTGGTTEIKLFNALLSQDSFRKEFYSRFAIYMGDILHPITTNQIIDSLASIIEKEMQFHILRWRDSSLPWNDISTWKYHVREMKNWCMQRNLYLYHKIDSFFNLGGIVKTDINTGDLIPDNTISLNVNGVHLFNQSFDGYYFKGNTLKVNLEGDIKFTGWEVTITANDQETKTIYYSKELEYVIPDNCTAVSISAYWDPLENAVTDFSNVLVTAHDGRLTIQGLSGKTKIAVYHMNGSISKEITTTNPSIEFPLPSKGIYLLVITDKNGAVTRKIIN